MLVKKHVVKNIFKSITLDLSWVHITRSYLSLLQFTHFSFYLLTNMFRHFAFIFFLWYDKSYENALSLTLRFTKSSLFFVNPYIVMHAQAYIILFQNTYILKAIRVTGLMNRFWIRQLGKGCAVFIWSAILLNHVKVH